MTDTDPERMALATAIFAARAAAFENEVEGDLYRMAGNYREAYAGVTAFRDELAFWGYTVTPLAATPAPLDDAPCGYCGSVDGLTPPGDWENDPIDGATLRLAIENASDLVNPRISEVDWNDVAAHWRVRVVREYAESLGLAPAPAPLDALVAALPMGPGEFATDGENTSYWGDVWAYRATVLAALAAYADDHA